MGRVKKYTVYIEGHTGTITQDQARVKGISFGTSFKDACVKLFEGDSNYTKEFNLYYECGNSRELFRTLKKAQKRAG